MAEFLQTIYVDQMQIFGGGGQPSPVPAPTPEPVAAPTPEPVTSPVPVGTETVGSVVFVERFGDEGVDILATQSDGTALVVSTLVFFTDPNRVRVI